MTAAEDIGGFVAAACTQLPLSKWSIGEWGVCGGLYTPNEVVSIATSVGGLLFPIIFHWIKCHPIVYHPFGFILFCLSFVHILRFDDLIHLFPSLRKPPAGYPTSPRSGRIGGSLWSEESVT
jgi:hypothetical protein